MRSVIIVKCCLVLFLLSFLAACGSPGEETSVMIPGGSTETVLSGQVADGYLVGARVFLDRNGNRRLDNGEPWTRSEARGRFSLEVTEGEENRYPVVAEITAGETIDEDQAGQYVTESYQLEAPVGRWSFISPLTTLVKTELDKNSSLTLPEAETLIREKIGLAAQASLFEDYIANDELEYAHRAARIIAGMMGRLQEEIELNVGMDDFDSQKAAIALLLSDLVMCHCDKIAMALDGAEDVTAIEEVLASIMADIDTYRLDSELLARYVERMQQDSPVWDMSSPEVISQIPAVDSSTSIDTVVKLSFDEPLDPTTILGNSIQVSGPSGPVAGTLAYDETRNELSFEPANYFMAYTSYQVDLTEMTDIFGNPVYQKQDWTFTTIFDQLPPDLPEF